MAILTTKRLTKQFGGLVAIDNLVIHDGYTVHFAESFGSSGLPTGWSTRGDAGWFSTGDMSFGGIGDSRSVRSGDIGHNESCELLMPLRHYESDQSIRMQIKLSTEASYDLFGISIYDDQGTPVDTIGYWAGITAEQG